MDNQSDSLLMDLNFNSIEADNKSEMHNKWLLDQNKCHRGNKTWRMLSGAVFSGRWYERTHQVRSVRKAVKEVRGMPMGRAVTGPWRGRETGVESDH